MYSGHRWVDREEIIGIQCVIYGEREKISRELLALSVERACNQCLSSNSEHTHHSHLGFSEFFTMKNQGCLKKWLTPGWHRKRKNRLGLSWNMKYSQNDGACQKDPKACLKRILLAQTGIICISK